MSFHNDNPVPMGPPDLCFETNSFVKDTFSVDHFLQEHRNKATLETMRDDLGIYLKVLRSAMIDLINKDYADFVNLSSNLIGLDKAINDIQIPLGQLREELLVVRKNLNDAANDIKTQLQLRRELREHKRSLRSLSRVHTSLKKLRFYLNSTESNEKLDLQCLERIVSEYNLIWFHVSRCKRDLSEADLRSFEKVSDKLMEYVNELFLENVALGAKGKDNLQRILAVYQTLDKVHEAEELYRKKIVSVAMENVITEGTLRSTATGLPGLYNRILFFINTDMRVISEVAASYNKSYIKYDFFLRSFWPEIAVKLETNLPSIFSPGDPDAFYQKYTDTLLFLENVLKEIGSISAVQAFQTDQYFIRFMEKWDLPVYFQIRFQDIVKDLELSFEHEPWSSNSEQWKLIASETVWKSLNKCWEEGVFLSPITHKFWKLSLQILSRFSMWIHSIEKTKSSRNHDVDFLVHLYSDIELLLSLLPSFKNLVLGKLPEINNHSIKRLGDSLEESSVEMKGHLENLSSLVLKALSGNSSSLLRQVNDIPRLFRRTNREPPTKPCSYVLSILDVPKKFHEKHHAHPKSVFWLAAMFTNFTKQYYICVAEVLDSVQKTEESLRRLKKARDRASNMVPNDRRVEDDNKIKLQLLIDVNTFIKGIETFGISRSSIDKLNDLLFLVEATQKS